MRFLALGFLALACASCSMGVSGNGRMEMDIVPLEPLEINPVQRGDVF